MLDEQLEQLWMHAKARIKVANDPKQQVRKQALAVGVPWPKPSGVEAVSEEAAFADVKTAHEAVRQAEAALAQAEEARAQAASARSRAVDTFEATVDKKIGFIEDETRYWQEGLEEASEPPPVLRSFRDLSVDPKLDLAKLPNAAGPFVQEVVSRVRASETGPLNKGINEVFGRAEKESVWRTGHQYFGGLELLGRGYGTDLHVTESARLFDIIASRLVERSFTHKGKTITVWEMRWQGTHVRTGETLSVGPDNDKEEAGGWTTMRRVASNMARNLKTHPENAGRVKLAKKYIRANEDKWLLKNGGDPDWRIPNERTMHTALARLGGFIRNLSMEDDSEIRKELEASIAKWTPLLADEFLPYDDHLTGEPCATWCYNSLAATTKRDVKPGSDQHITDTAHLGVYCLPVTASVFELGLEGLDYFNRADLQRRVANGLWFALFADRPYKFRVYDDGAWHEGQGDMNMDISPRDMACNDTTEYRRREKQEPQRLVRKLKGYATGAPRIIKHGDEWRSGGNHRKGPYGIEAFPQGQAWLFAHPGYKEMSEGELIGTPEKPIITTPMILSTFAGRAFAESPQAQRWASSK